MEAVRCDPGDHVPLALANRVASFLEDRIDLVPGIPEPGLVSTEESAVNGIPGDGNRQLIQVRDVDERSIAPLELAGQPATLPEALVSIEVVSKFDHNIGVRSGASLIVEKREFHFVQTGQRLEKPRLIETGGEKGPLVPAAIAPYRQAQLVDDWCQILEDFAGPSMHGENR